MLEKHITRGRFLIVLLCKSPFMNVRHGRTVLGQLQNGN